MVDKEDEIVETNKDSDNASVGTLDEVISHDGDSVADEVDTPSHHDIEAQPLIEEIEEKIHSQPQPVAAEYDVETRRKLFYLAGYFTLNLVLTIYNKAVLGGFHFPWLLTAIHCTCVSLGCYGLLLRDYFKLSDLGTPHHLVLVAFSLLFTLNIAISNVSL